MPRYCLGTLPTVLYLTILAGLQLAVIVALLYLRDRERDANAKLLADFSQRAEAERLQLVNHIKAPTYLTPTGASRPAQVEQPHPNLAKIGTFAPTGEG